jgi:hypothetical protein
MEMGFEYRIPDVGAAGGGVVLDVYLLASTAVNLSLRCS